MTKDFTPQDVAALSGRAVSTILQWIRSKKLKAHKARGYVIAADDVLEFLLKQAERPEKTGE
jgi:Helix-turn-helix domain